MSENEQNSTRADLAFISCTGFNFARVAVPFFKDNSISHICIQNLSTVRYFHPFQVMPVQVHHAIFMHFHCLRLHRWHPATNKKLRYLYKNLKYSLILSMPASKWRPYHWVLLWLPSEELRC